MSKFYKSVFDKLDVTYLNNEIVNKKVFNIYECKRYGKRSKLCM